MDLPRSTVEELRAIANQDFPLRQRDRYGEPLVTVIQRDGESGSWLEAAVLAGHVPFIDGIVLAIRAHHMWLMQEVAGADPLADEWLSCGGFAQDYREAEGILAGCIAELEGGVAKFWRAVADASDADGKRRAVEARESASVRAASAMSRRADSRRDWDAVFGRSTKS